MLAVGLEATSLLKALASVAGAGTRAALISSGAANTHGRLFSSGKIGRRGERPTSGQFTPEPPASCAASAPAEGAAAQSNRQCPPSLSSPYDWTFLSLQKQRQYLEAVRDFHGAGTIVEGSTKAGVPLIALIEPEMRDIWECSSWMAGLYGAPARTLTGESLLRLTARQQLAEVKPNPFGPTAEALLRLSRARTHTLLAALLTMAAAPPGSSGSKLLPEGGPSKPLPEGSPSAGAGAGAGCAPGGEDPAVAKPLDSIASLFRPRALKVFPLDGCIANCLVTNISVRVSAKLRDDWLHWLAAARAQHPGNRLLQHLSSTPSEEAPPGIGLAGLLLANG